MAKYLGAQIGELAPGERTVDYRNLREAPLPDRFPETYLEANEVRIRVLYELITEFGSLLPILRDQFPHEDLKRELNKSEDPLGSALQFLQEYLRQFVDEVDDRAASRVDLNLPLDLADFSISIQATLDGQHVHNILDHFRGELHTGTIIWMEFIELIGTVYGQQFGETIDEETYRKILQSNTFIQVALALGFSGAHAEHAILGQSLVEMKEEGRYRLNEDHFEFITRGDQLMLVMKSAILEKAKEASGDTLKNPNVAIGSCPASFVKGEKHPVLREFVEWLNALCIRHYVPRVSRPSIPNAPRP